MAHFSVKVFLNYHIWRQFNQYNKRTRQKKQQKYVDWFSYPWLVAILLRNELILRPEAHQQSFERGARASKKKSLHFYDWSNKLQSAFYGLKCMRSMSLCRRKCTTGWLQRCMIYIYIYKQPQCKCATEVITVRKARTHKHITI